MGTKNNPGEFDCYANALPDEPMFILLARDQHAPALIEAWAKQRETDILNGARPKADLPMVREARECARQMRLWRQANEATWRVPQPIRVLKTCRFCDQRDRCENRACEKGLDKDFHTTRRAEPVHARAS